MLQPNPKSNCYNFNLPDEFFIPQVCEKYNKMIDMLDGTFGSIQDIINESIISIDLPGFSFDPTERTTQANGLNEYILSKPNKTLYEILDSKDFSVSLRFCDGYLNYYCLLEHFFVKFMSKRDTNTYNKNNKETNKHEYVNLPVTLLMLNGYPLFTCILKNCLFNSISQINLTQNQISRDFKEFKITFRFSNIDCSVDIPSLMGD